MHHESSTTQVTGWQRDLVLFLDRQIYRLAKHWLAAINVVVAIYVLLPLLAPLLMVIGAPGIARLIYLAYRPACHQLPERSFFVLGAQPAYSLQELQALGLISETDDIFARQRFLGALTTGYKLALCQRDMALYGSILLGGLIYGLLGKRLRPLPLVAFLLALVPLAIDGGTQLILLRESTPLLRLFTGGSAGLAAVWTLYPRLDVAFQDVRIQANKRVHLE
jgi:uncharacterized membrane protein